MKTSRQRAWRRDIADGFIVMVDSRGARLVADGLHYTNEVRLSPAGLALCAELDGLIEKANPIAAAQLFAAAYGDYSRGNYDLAISEFRQYVDTYPTSEMADNAQYWIGECFYSKKLLNEAIAEFDKVSIVFPKGDKVPGARFKKAMVLLDLGQTDAARAEFLAIIKLYPKSNEAVLAKQQLEK